MPLTIDHVTIAGSALPPMQDKFAQLGLTTDYGGPHSNGITHMALLGFQDGSYIELISSLEPNPPATAFWSRHIVNDGGPCAWAIQVADVATEAARVAGLGITVEGPAYYNRQRPDGQLVEWDLAFLGNDGAGAMLPFIIKDITPRSLRVQPSASVAGRDCPLTGLARVILGVPDLAAAVSLFRRVYNWPEPIRETKPARQAELAYFPETPVILATPTVADSVLGKRLVKYGPSPWGYLLGTSDFELSGRHFQLVDSTTWFDQPVAWFDLSHLPSPILGVIG